MNIPADVEKVIRTIESAGYTAWAVGGCVRDSLLGKEPKDFDVASSCPPETVCTLFPKCIKTGIKYGTVTVITDSMPVEVTVFRSESGYRDSRHPDFVTPAEDIVTDLSRRDFTVNALAWHPSRGLCDPFGGRQDLANKIIRAVGDPNNRFDEDALRILRCFRFASALDFDIETNTYNAAIEKSPNLCRISAERVREELLKLISGSRPQLVAPVIDAGGLSAFGIRKISNPILLRNLPNNITTRLAGFLWCCLEDYSKPNIEKTMSNLRMDKRATALMCALISEMSRPLPKTGVEVKKRFSCLAPEHWGILLTLRRVLLGEENSFLKDVVSKASVEPWNRSMLKVTGNDLNLIGIKGIDTGRVLEILLDKVINDPALNEYNTLINIAAKLKSDIVTPG